VDSALKNKQTVADMFNAVLQAHPNKEAIVFVDKQDHLTRNTKVSYTYAEVEAESNKGEERACACARACVFRCSS
jgi:acyl-CoA synthetase (AMP-forming)/AMP-acid ligase II